MTGLIEMFQSAMIGVRLRAAAGKTGRVLLAAAMLAGGFCAHGADVVVDRAQTFQTISGWGHGGGVLGGTTGAASMLAAALADPVNYQYLDFLVDDLGLTGTRTWEVGSRIDGIGTDDGDCDVVDWNLFEGDTLSAQSAAYLLNYQNRILTNVKPWVMNDPGERAQQIWASALYCKTNFGLNTSYAVIYNEPSMASTILADRSEEHT